MKTPLEYLNQRKEMAWHNRLCYSANYGMNTPKPGYEAQFADAVRDCEIVEELTVLVKEKETPAKQTPPTDQSSFREKMLKHVDEFLEPLLDENSKAREQADYEDNALNDRENMLIFLANLARKECRKPLETDAEKLRDLVDLAFSDNVILRVEPEDGDLFRIKIVDIPYKRHYADIMIGSLNHSYWIESYTFYE